jgi:hypothetical protein
MALDALEKEHLRKKMAWKMGSFLEGGTSVSCVSGHVYEQPHLCDLCQDVHTEDILVIKNRASKKMSVASTCLKEMVRFKVTDVEDLTRWLEKLRELRSELEVRKVELAKAREEERKRLEKKFIVRKRTTV